MYVLRYFCIHNLYPLSNRAMEYITMLFKIDDVPSSHRIPGWWSSMISIYQCLARLFSHFSLLFFDQWFKVFIYTYIYVYICMYQNVIILWKGRCSLWSFIQPIARLVAISSCLLEKPAVMDLAVPLFSIKIEKFFCNRLHISILLAHHGASGQKMLEQADWSNYIYIYKYYIISNVIVIIIVVTILL